MALRHVAAAIVEANSAWKVPALLRQLHGPKALVVASADPVYDQHAQRMWMELLKAGTEAYIIRCGDGYPNVATVEDGASILTRAGISSILCIGTLGAQEAAKAMRAMHSTGASTMEGAIDRLQQKEMGTRSSIHITFFPTDLSPPAWSRVNTLCFHPTVPAITTLPPCLGQVSVCYDSELMASCMKATKSSGASLLGLVAAAIDAEVMAPSFVSATMPKLDLTNKDLYAELTSETIEQLTEWMIDRLSLQYGHFFGALELVGLFSRSSALHNHATLASAQAVRSLVQTLKEHEEQLDDGEDEHDPMYAMLRTLQEATGRVLGSSSLPLDAFSETVDHVLEQYGEPTSLDLADVDTAVDILQAASPEWIDSLGFQAHQRNDGYERIIRLIASAK